MRRFIARLLMFPGAFVAVLIVQSVGARLIQRIIVTAFYGESAYASGLRLSVKSDAFSNGDPGPSWALAPFLILALVDGMAFLFVFVFAARLARNGSR